MASRTSRRRSGRPSVDSVEDQAEEESREVPRILPMNPPRRQYPRPNPSNIDDDGIRVYGSRKVQSSRASSLHHAGPHADDNGGKSPDVRRPDTGNIDDDGIRVWGSGKVQSSRSSSLHRAEPRSDDFDPKSRIRLPDVGNINLNGVWDSLHKQKKTKKLADDSDGKPLDIRLPDVGNINLDGVWDSLHKQKKTKKLADDIREWLDNSESESEDNYLTESWDQKQEQKKPPRQVQTDVFIAVMGVTGAGKSSFISLLTKESVTIGGGLEACTNKVAKFTCQLDPATTVHLIDTPGFDDTDRSDAEILREIASWLKASYAESIKLNGIIYLHRITDNRMQGSAKRNLLMFKKLCGENALKNVILATTMWDRTSLDEGARREAELKHTPQFWGLMMEQGSTVLRHTNDAESARHLVSYLIKKDPITLGIQQQMVDEHKPLHETEAGITLDSELAKEREKFARELRHVQMDMQEALKLRDQQAIEMFQEVMEKNEKRMQQLEAEKLAIKADMEKLYHDKYLELERQLQEIQRNRSQQVDNEPRDNTRGSHLVESSASRGEELPDLRVHSKYRLGPKISGPSGRVYAGTNIITGEEVAIKLASLKAQKRRLKTEHLSLKALAGGVGIPRVYHFGPEGDYLALVVNNLGPSLEDLIDFCNQRFSLKTVLMLADQILSRLEFIHAKSYVHGDVRPRNLMMGVGRNGNLVYLSGFGRSKRYRNPESYDHIPYRKGQMPLGKIRYASIRTSSGAEHSRRDDLESLGYTLLYFLHGSLPWQGIPRLHPRTGPTSLSEFLLGKQKRTPWKKEDATVEELCRSYPEEFGTYMRYVRGLAFKTKPDYSYLRKLFHDLFVRESFEYDYIFDWVPITRQGGQDMDKADEKKDTQATATTSRYENDRPSNRGRRASERHSRGNGYDDGGDPLSNSHHT